MNELAAYDDGTGPMPMRQTNPGATVGAGIGEQVGWSDSVGSKLSGTPQTDMVAIGEFSELVGPVARHLLPSLNCFNHDILSSYILKFMSCDFQQAQIGQSSAASLLGMQAQDSQVLMPLPDETGFAYVHHVAFLDVVARGYVRPFCVCYIAHEPLKIMKNFGSMLQAVNQICTLLKLGNQKAFHRDILLLLEHLEQKKASLLEKIESVRKEVAAPPLKVTTSAAEQQPPRNATPPLILKVQTSPSPSPSSSPSPSPSPPPSLSSDSPPSTPSLIVQTQEEPSSSTATASPSLNVTLSPSTTSPPSVSPSLNVTLSPATTSPPSPSPSLNVTLSPSASSPPASPTVTTTTIRTSIAPLIKGQTLEAQYLTSLRNITDFINELRVIEEEFAAYLSQQTRDADIDEIISKVATLSSGTGSMPAKFLSVPTIDADAKKDCYDHNTTAEAERPDFSHILNNIIDAADDDLRRTGLKTLRSLSNLCGGVNGPEYTAACYRLHLLHTHFSRPAIILEFEQEERHTIHPSSSLLTIGRCPIMNFNWEPDTVAPGPASFDPLQPLSFDGIALESFASSLWSVSSCRTGHGLARMCNEYHFLPHVVYSIMTGRPTIIYGPESYRRRIRQLIRALSLFVPGISSSGRWIEEWRSSPLRLIDLSYFKLVGLEKKPHMLPDVVKRHSTIFDVEESWVWSPPYTGDFLTSLLCLPHTREEGSWPTEEVFLAYVHEQLYQFALRASLYYHLCCVGVAETSASLPSPAAGVGGTSHYTSISTLGLRPATAESIMGARGIIPSTSSESLSGRRSKNHRSRTSSLSLLPSSSKDGRKGRISQSDYSAQERLAFISREATADMHLSTTSELLGSESLLSARFHSTETSDLRIRDMFFERFGVKEHDQQIIEYLVRLIKTEQTIEMETICGSQNLPAFIAPTIRLAPVPCQKFMNVRPAPQPQAKRRNNDEKRR